TVGSQMMSRRLVSLRNTNAAPSTVSTLSPACVQSITSPAICRATKYCTNENSARMRRSGRSTHGGNARRNAAISASAAKGNSPAGATGQGGSDGAATGSGAGDGAVDGEGIIDGAATRGGGAAPRAPPGTHSRRG